MDQAKEIRNIEDCLAQVDDAILRASSVGAGMGLLHIDTCGCSLIRLRVL